MKEDIKEALDTYNKIAKIYAEYTSEKLMQYQLNNFISMLPKKGRVLDVGCGCGRDSAYFEDFGLNVTAIDVSDSLLNEAGKLVKNVEFMNMDMKNLTFKNESFDGVWIMASLSDIEKKDCLDALKGFFRVLKKNGVMYIAVKEGKGEKIEKKLRYDNMPRFYAYYEQLELEELLKKAGFVILNSITSEDQGTEWVEVFVKK